MEEERSDNLGATPEQGQVVKETKTAKPTGQVSPETPAAPQEGQAESGKYGQFGDDPDELWKAYQHLERYKGKWKEVVSKADRYDELLKASEGLAEEVPAEQEQTQETQTGQDPDWLELINSKVEETLSKRLAPVEKFVRSQEEAATRANIQKEISEFRSAHKEISNEQWESLSVNPVFRKLVMMRNPQTGERLGLEEAYRVLSYEEAKKQGATETYNQLKEKSRLPKTPTGTKSADARSDLSLDDAIEKGLEEAGFGDLK